MPRPLRVFYPGAWYHVMNRGLGYRNIFDNNKHRQIFIDLLAETSEQFSLEIHSYCLMDNHYHLLVCTPLGNLARAMQHINGVYTQRYNNDTGTDGPLFRGRYHAILIDEDAYLLQVSRYIHLNPLVAKIIKNLESFIWSSYRYYIGLEKSPNWLHTNNILSMIGGHNQSIGYKKFVRAGLDDETFSFYAEQKSKIYFGSDRNKNKLFGTLNEEKIQASITDYRRLEVRPDLNSVIDCFTQFFNFDVTKLKSSQRGRVKMHRCLAIYACRKLTQATLAEIGKKFGISVTGVSNAVIRTKQKFVKDATLRNLFADFEKEIANKE